MSKFTSVLLFSFFSVLCIAQTSPMRFQHLTINDGLSLSSVYCIKKDSKGFMWFGTEDGLNRFDGYQFRIFRPDSRNTNSICYKWIEHIEEDNLSQLWFGSRQGLSSYNPVNESFTNYRSEEDNGLINDTITCLYAYKQKLIAGTMNGVSVINTESLIVERHIDAGRTYSISCNSTSCVVAGEKGLFIITDNDVEQFVFGEYSGPIIDLFTLNNYLYCSTATAIIKLDYDTLKPEIIKPFTKGFVDEVIEKCIVDNKGRLWISTSSGLFVHFQHKGITKRLVTTSSTSNSLAINYKKCLYHHKNGIVWFASHGDGLFLIDQKLQITSCQHNPTDEESVSQNTFNCLYPDEQLGDVWLGTYGAGIDIFHNNANKFDLLKHNPLNSNSLPSNFIWSVYESRDSCIWMGTNDKGLSCYCPSSGLYSNLPLSIKAVRDVFEDCNDVIWVGTDGDGLLKFDQINSCFISYEHDTDDNSSISDNSVRVIYEDSKNRLWVGTRNGLNKMDRSTGTFKSYLHDSNDIHSLSCNFIYSSITEDRSGNIWVGTYGGGLNKLNPATDQFECFSSSGSEGFQLSDDIVFSIYEDKKGLLWIGTNEGLNVLDVENHKIEVYSIKDGLPNEVIYSIMPDDTGKLWLSTNNGICCFDPKTKKCKNYDVSDGLQSNEFNGGAFHKGKTGKLYFGGVYGLNILNPNQVQNNTLVNQPVITRLEVLGSEVGVSTKGDIGHEVVVVDSLYVINSNISYTKHITLDYSQRYFAIEYSGLNHLFPDKTKYAFQLYPIDKNWNKAGSRNYVSFSNLKSGDYQIRVKSTNADGVWSTSMATLDITVLPPFWLRNWFIFLEIILVLALIVFVNRYLIKIRTNKILRIQNEQIREANLQLKASEDDLRAMNATKDKFFSIISHDLKNPFTSLMSISDVLVANYDVADDEDRKTSVKRIHNSVKSIYYLLENLLTWSRSQRGKICFENNAFDLSALISENINLYREAAQRKNIVLTNQVEEIIMAYADRNTINTIIRNLSGNAVKFTKVEGEIIYSISNYGDYWKVSIKDNGVGLSEEHQQRLFCIDKKIKTEGTIGEKGTGLGLVICKEFTDKNGGQIGVNSKVGQGSEFWFTVKKEK